MASIHKRPRSPYWRASFKNASGEWIKKTTKQTDRKLAQKIADGWEAMGGGSMSEAQIRKVASELCEQTTGKAITFYSCRKWFDEWLANKTGTTAPSTLTKYQQICGSFIKHLGDRAELSLNAVSVSDVREYRDSLLAGGRAASTVNQTLRKNLSIPFMAALRLGYIAMNPVNGVEAIKDNEKGEADIFTLEQLRMLVAAADGDWKGAILMGFFTGLRLGDVANLTWEAIDLNEGLLRLPTKKTGKPVTIPLGEDMLYWLKGRPAGIGKAPIFPDLTGKTGSGRNGLSPQFTRIMEAAGIKGRVLRVGSGKGRTRVSLGFHSWRHTFTSMLANAGIPEEVRQKLTAHSDGKSHAIYTHLDIETFRNAISKLPSIGGGK